MSYKRHRLPELLLLLLLLLPPPLPHTAAAAILHLRWGNPGLVWPCCCRHSTAALGQSWLGVAMLLLPGPGSTYAMAWLHPWLGHRMA